MDQILVEPLTLFVTDREQFDAKYETNPFVVAFAKNVFLESESRPQQAEHIAVIRMGHTICREKKYDGMIYSNGQFVRYSEFKVTCRRTDEDGNLGKMGSIQINDVTQDIVDRYIQDQPLFVFPYYIDGHLAAMLSVDFSVIRPAYEKCVKKFKGADIYGRKSFGLSLGSWINDATVEFVHKDTNIVEQLPPMMQRKIYQTHPDYQRSNSMTGIVKFPEDHQFARFGFNFDTDCVVSYARDPNGVDRAPKSGIKIKEVSFGHAVLKKAATELSGLTCPSIPAPRKNGTVKVTSTPTQGATGKKMFVTFTQEITENMTIADIRRQFNVITAKMEIITA